jgi:hypothetical protein
MQNMLNMHNVEEYAGYAKRFTYCTYLKYFVYCTNSSSTHLNQSSTVIHLMWFENARRYLSCSAQVAASPMIKNQNRGIRT